MVYRYFHMPIQKATVMFDIQDNSDAATAPAVEFEKLMKTPVIEVDRKSYLKWQKQYSFRDEV